MAETIRVVLAENDPSELAKLQEMLSSEPDIRVIGVARDGKECLDQTIRQRPDIVLIREDLPVIRGLDAAEQITAELPEVGVILVLNGTEGEEIWHKMLRAGIREFMNRPIETDKLVEEVRKVAALQRKVAKTGRGDAAGAAEEAPEQKRQIITVCGPRGGCGKTVIATNLAVAMGGTSDKIALVDLNLWGGDISMLLDLTPRRTLGDLLPGFGGIDYDVVDAAMVKHPSGVSVLPAPLTGSFDGTTLSRYIVQTILDALREHYECTIVDTGYANLESTLAAMDYSDLIVVVVRMDLPRLRDGKHYLKNLIAANYPKDKLRVVVNRVGSSKEISPTEVESILEFPVFERLPNDEALVNTSINLGQPFVTASPHKPLSRSLLTLAQNLAPAGVEIAAKKRGGSRWFSFMQ